MYMNMNVTYICELNITVLNKLHRIKFLQQIYYIISETKNI